MKEYEDLTVDDKRKYLNDLEQMLANSTGCPPKYLRSNNTECFYCTECKINAIKKDLGIE